MERFVSRVLGHTVIATGSGRYINSGKNLSASRMDALTRFVDGRLAMTKTDMDARSLCSRRGICSKGMQKQYTNYKESLDTHFGKSGIKVSLIFKFNRGLEEYCECDNHITGLDLSVKSLAIGTQLSADGNTCFSKYFKHLLLKIPHQDPSRLTSVCSYLPFAHSGSRQSVRAILRAGQQGDPDHCYEIPPR
jgi:hypothetical protein